MKRFVLVLSFFVAASFLMSGQTVSAAEVSDGDVRPSIAHGTGSEGDKVKYAGNVTAYINFIGVAVSTTHGVIFPSCDIYVGGNAEYSYNWGYRYTNLAAEGRWFYPRKGKVQGYIGLEAGVSVLLPGVKFDNSTGHDRNILASAEFFVRPALGMVVNFRKVSLDIGVKCGFSPYVMLCTDNGTFWHPIPAFGVGLWF